MLDNLNIHFLFFISNRGSQWMVWYVGGGAKNKDHVRVWFEAVAKTGWRTLVCQFFKLFFFRITQVHTQVLTTRTQTLSLRAPPKDCAGTSRD
jgi:hypothetical protein